MLAQAEISADGSLEIVICARNKHEEKLMPSKQDLDRWRLQFSVEYDKNNQYGLTRMLTIRVSRKLNSTAVEQDNSAIERMERDAANLAAKRVPGRIVGKLL